MVALALCAFVMLVSHGQLIPVGCASTYDYGSRLKQVREFDEVRGCDLSGIEGVITSDVLKTLTFDAATRWPEKSKMPIDIAPDDLVEYGKDPCLGVRQLHKKGYTGKGVSVALFDQPLMRDHESYGNVDYTYTILNQDADQRSSMHGPAVMSLLAGHEIGVAPDAKVFYYAYPSWKADQKNEADLFYHVIERNKALPPDEQIRVISMSHGVDRSCINGELLARAERAARDAGIIVIDVATIDIGAVRAVPLADKNDPSSYVAASWARYWGGCLYVPTGRTTADGKANRNNGYIFWEGGGLSWAVPYVAGVIALGLQVDPALTEKAAIEYLYASGYDFHGGKLINPAGFIDLVTRNCPNPRDVSLDRDYRYVLYNADRVSEDDLQAIGHYMAQFSDGVMNILMDVSQCASAPDIYDMLVLESKTRRGRLKGIQIFGTSRDVPAFDIRYKIQAAKGIEECGSFKSDFFYSNFMNDSRYLREDFSIYRALNEKLNVSFVPEWTVSRLPLTMGEIAPFMARNAEYVAMIGDRPFGNVVNFSSPIFASSNHTDDFGAFLRDKVDREFGILSKGDYTLYGNRQGRYPVSASVAGDFTKENVAKENRKGIMEFIINAHGQWNNIDQCIYTSSDNSSEKRVSFLNTETINSVLAENYYDLDLWTCLNGYNLDDSNLVHEAMSNGKCMSAMATSSTLSNNGVRNDVSLSQMKKNNFYYFYLVYLHSRALGHARSESFTLGKRAYAQEILKNTSMLLEGNYQFNLHNVLAYHYLGLIEYWRCPGRSGYKPRIDVGPAAAERASSGADPDTASVPDGSIMFSSKYSGSGLRVLSLIARRIGYRIRLVLEYQSSRDCDYSLFNPPNGDKVMKVVRNGISMGRHRTELDLGWYELKALLEVGNVTMRFGFGEPSDFVFFDTEQLRPLFEAGSK